jgi:methylated-DNA-protein-cysteine methyltransferase-like protein
MESPYDQIYTTTRRIPKGRVSSYGRIAALAGYPRHARMVGYALHALRDTAEQRSVPWWRVLNAAGRISNPYQPELQRAILEAEGVAFDERGYADLRSYLWDGDE